MALIGVTDGAFVPEIRNALKFVGGYETRMIHDIDDMQGISGIVLSGGGDVDPNRYGEGFSAMIWGMDKYRDDLEFSLLDRCQANGIPYMGICRGHQVVGVHAGMKLIPDISWNHTNNLGAHGLDNSPHHHITGKLASIGSVVNSLHHQAVPNDSDRLSECGIEVLALSDNQNMGDNRIVEAMRGDGFMSVQWHPELDWNYVGISNHVFEMFAGLVDG